jgi:tetratricopeptide (TPR) repeat protein
MKKLIAIVSVCCLLGDTSAQSKLKVVQLLPEQSHYLKGESHATPGTVSRTCLRVTLPPNTVSWYYTFTTTSNKGEKTAPIKLADQLRKVLDTTGKTEFHIDSIFVPAGTMPIDAYLLQTADDANKFKRNQEDMLYNVSATRKHSMMETVVVKEVLHGTCYIGLREPGAKGANVAIEAAAIVRETPRNVIQAENLASLGWKEYQAGHFDKCIDYCNQALALDSNLSSVQFNKALSSMVMGNNAYELYVTGMRLNKNDDDARQVCLTAIDNIDAAVKKYDNLQNVELIREKLAKRAEDLR